MADRIYSDINARLPLVSDRDDVIIYERESIIQSIYRLIYTEEGEIPYYRVYGLSLKKFLHYPLTLDTGLQIYNYIVERIKRFETRVEVVDEQSIIDYNPNNSAVLITLYLRIISTNEVFSISIDEIIVNQ